MLKDIEAMQSLSKYATADFKPECWYWLSVLVLQRVSLGIVQALVILTATSRALLGVVICSIASLLHVRFHPFVDDGRNTAQSLLLFSAVVVAVLNVVR